jgi:membrane protein required for colicin V production
VAIDSYDMVMLGLLATAGVLGYFKGIVWQIAWIAGICLSSYVSLRFSGELSSLTGQPPPWNRLLAMLALYVATSLVVWVTFRFVSSLIDAVHLSAFDHQLGLVFGLAKGALICVVVTFFAVTMMPAYRSEITGSQSGQIVAKLIGEADQFLPADIHETVDPFLQQFQQQFDEGDVNSSQGVVAAQSGQNEGASWQSVLEGVTSVAAWAGVEAGDESGERGAESPSPVKAAAAWMTSESSTGKTVDAAGRYLNQNSAFGGSGVPSPATVLPPQNQWQGNVPQRFPVGSQTPLPVRP